MYEDLYAPLPDVKKYLNRIGIDEKIEPTRENLDRLIFANLTHIPFENLDECIDKTCPNLGITELFDKIVIRQRGGYCFELNALFYSFLDAMGYKVYPVACRILWGSSERRPLSHRATIAIIDGEKYYCDVGFGGPSAHQSVPFSESVEGGFFIETDGRMTMVKCKTEKGIDTLIEFSDYPFDPVDFVPLNYNVAMAPGSYFQMMPMINLTTDTGSKSITGDVFKRHSGDVSEEIKLEDEIIMKEYLLKEFGIVK